jgi:molybdopterin/thiamine biosynthesis adenylyltransferase
MKNLLGKIDKPLILNIKKPKDKKSFENLIKNKVKLIDFFEEQIKELCAVKKIKLTPRKANLLYKNSFWIYYPWHNVLFHTLDKNNFRAVRLSRNAVLISKDEQKRISKFRVGIAGLNVGSPVILSLVLQGFEKFKIADNDTFELSNLNRLSAGLSLLDVGLNKATLTCRYAYEIDPFLEIDSFNNGLNENNLKEFLLKKKINILVEEMDNLKLKVLIRELARKHRIPVVMATGNGSNVIVDVERYDLQPDLPLLSGFLTQDVIRRIFEGKSAEKSVREKILLARDFIGEKFLTQKLVSAFKLVGSKIAGIPQISEVSFLRAGVLGYIVRTILLNSNIRSGRYLFETDRIFQQPIKH